jgi:threonine/homoserine/homoserine lactone efflux protein
MSYLALFAWSFAIAIGPVISPGPVSTAIVAEGARRGFRAGPLVATGHALTELVMVAALALGMGHVLGQPLLGAAIGVSGGVLLLWLGATMGWGAVRRKPSLPRASHGGQEGGGSLLGLGVVATLGNPFWYAWWIGVGGGYVLSTWEQGPLALAAFYLGHISADYAWDTLLATVVASGRAWLTDKTYQVLLFVCGLFLIYTGVRFIWTGVQHALL